MLGGMIPYLKRALPFVLIGAAFFVSAQLAFAQGGGADSGQAANNPTGSGLDYYLGGNATYGPVGGGVDPVTGAPIPGSIDPATGLPVPPDTTVTEETPTVQVVGDCWVSPAGFLNCLVVSFFGTLTAFAGSAFDTAIVMFVTGFGQYYNDYGIGYTVENIWGTIRDIFNLTFIFGLVYIGFQIILGVNESGAKRTIPLLILAALLVNFSLFAVKFVVDFSNIAAVQIYSLYQVGDQETPSEVTPAIDVLRPESGEVSIALAFTNQMGVTGLLNSNAPMDENGSGITYMFTMVIIFLVLTYVFFAGAILITIRFAVLVFYMIFSPVMFLGWVFPGMASYSKKFWHGLLGQAFFAPALLFMLYISYRVMAGFNDGDRAGGEGIVGTGDPNSFAIFIPYLIINVVFIFGSLVVARKMGAVGADTAVSMGQKAQKWGRGALWAGTAGALGGAAGAYAYKKIDAAANAEQDGVSRRLARGLTYAGVRDKAEKAYKGSVQGQWKENRKKRDGEMANRAADASLGRSITAGLTAAAGSQEQIDFERSIQDANQAQLITALKKHEPGSDGYNRIVRAMSHNQVKDLLNAKNDVFDAGRQTALKNAYTEQTLSRMTIGTGTNGANRSLPDAISRASVEDLSAIGLPNILPHAANISAARMDDLRSKLTPTEHQNLTRQRTTQLQAMMSNPVSRTQVFARKSDKEIARLPREVLLATDSSGKPLAIEHLNRNVLDIMMQGNSNDSYVNPTDRALIKNLITSGQVLNANVSDMANWLTNSPRGRGF
jgi:hypothetical protein